MSLWILLLAGVLKASATCCIEGCRLRMGLEMVRMWFLTARFLLSRGDGIVAQETTGEQHPLSLHMETFTHAASRRQEYDCSRPDSRI